MINTQTIIYLVTLMIAQSAGAFPVVPLPKLTAGALCSRQDSDFAGYRHPEKVPFCRRHVSRETRAEIYDSYNIPGQCRGRYTVDHFYPLSIGGSNSKKNLWPEHREVKQLRFDLEQEVFDQMSAGKLKQREALEIINHAKLNPPVQDLPKSSNPCDKPEMIMQVIQSFASGMLEI